MDMRLRMTPKLVPAILVALAIPIACFAVNPGEKALRVCPDGHRRWTCPRTSSPTTKPP